MARYEQYTEKTSLVDNDLFLIADSADLDTSGRPKTKKIKKINAILPISQTISATKTSSYTITDLDNIGVLYCNFSVDGTITLPTLADNQDRELFIQNISTGGSIVTIDGEGAEAINSQATVKLVSKNNYLKIKAESGAWRVQDFQIDYQTGWINRSDWTNVHLGSNTALNVDSNFTHNFDVEMGSIETYIFISSTASFDSTTYLLSIFVEATVNSGMQVYYIDTNNIKFQTGSIGIYLLDDSGASSNILDTENWYYKIVSKRINIL